MLAKLLMHFNARTRRLRCVWSHVGFRTKQAFLLIKKDDLYEPKGVGRTDSVDLCFRGLSGTRLRVHKMARLGATA
jgi:hypothetical protein